jgi:hypothetical protein
VRQFNKTLKSLMSTTSSSCTTNTWEKVHAFTNHGTLGPSKKPRKLEWEFNQVV